MRARALVAVIGFVLACATPASAQWRIETTVDDFTDEVSSTLLNPGRQNQWALLIFPCGELRVYVGGIMARPRFGDVDMRWDDGEIESWSTFAVVSDRMLQLDQGWVEEFVGKLRQHDDLRLRVPGSGSDRFDVRGLSDLLADPPCE